MDQIQKRHTAYKVKISDINDGRYVKNEGNEPNYILTPSQQKVSRVNIIGIVVSSGNDEGSKSIVIEDSSGRISIFSFDDSVDLSDKDVGDIVVVIGRPREYNSQKYIVPEIIKKINNPAWIKLRKLELEKIYSNLPEPEDIENIKDEKTKDDLPEEDIISIGELPVSEDADARSREDVMGLFEKVYSTIKDKDSGKGTTYEEVIEECGPDSEKAIEALLKRGEIFEIAAGRLKVLE